MLFGIPPSLSAGLLELLASMGHGDKLVVCDANFPAYSVARSTQAGRPVEFGNSTSAEAVADILALLPLDAFDEQPAIAMAVPGDHARPPDVHREVNDVLAHQPGPPWVLAPIDRFDFYARAADSFAIVRTLERRPYGCFLFKKGVLTPDGELMTPAFANRV